MIYRVTAARWRPAWGMLPVLWGLLLQVTAPLPVAHRAAEQAAVAWLVNEGWQGYTRHEGVLICRARVAPSPAYHPGPVRIPRRMPPQQALPRSAFGDARWSPIRDQIVGPDGREWEPFEKPSPWYFTGVLWRATGGTPASFTSACNSAVDSDIVEVASDITFTATYAFPARGTPGYVLVRGDGFSLAQETRVTPATFAGAYTLTTNITSGNPGGTVFTMAQGASGWYFRGLKIANGVVSSANPAEALMQWAASTQTQTQHVPTKLIAEQCWLTNPWAPATASTVQCKRGIANSAHYTQMLELRIDGMAGAGLETQAILFARGLGRALVRNNYLEGATENIMFGGAGAGQLGAVDYNADIMIRRSHLFKRLDWMNVSSSVATRKNFVESKNHVRLVVEGCEAENHDGNGQQHDLVFNCKPASPADEALAKCDDTWVRYCRFRASYGPVNIGAAANDAGDNRNPGVQRIQITSCLWQDSRCVPGSPNAGSGRFQIVGLQNSARTCPQVVIEWCTAQTGNSVLTISGNSSSNQTSIPGLVFRNNVCYLNTQYASPRSNTLTGSTGLDYWCGSGGWTFAGNVAYSTYAGFTFPGTIASTNYKASTPIVFADAGAGDYTLTDARYLMVATDGGAPGVNMAQLMSFTAGVR